MVRSIQKEVRDVVVDFMLSERQQRVLAPLLMNPDRQYGTNELIAMSGAGVGAGGNLLAGLERSGVVTKSWRGNQLLYTINKGSRIFSELRSICMKTFGLASVVSRELAPFCDRIELAFLSDRWSGETTGPAATST